MVFAGAVCAIAVALTAAFLLGRLTAMPALPGGELPTEQRMQLPDAGAG
ncbi:MAG: hypothetical protein ACFCVG_10505 [Kineosporiaceae bacterium]